MNPRLRKLLAIVCIGFGILVLLIATCPEIRAADFPAGYYKYGKDCAKVQLRHYGRAWDPVLLAQIEQESGWRPHARSPYASGLTQFIPSTQRAVERKYGITGSIWKVDHACTLQALLMRDLAREVAPSFVGFFSQWAAVLRTYNGSPASFWCEWRKAGRPVDAFRMEPFSCRRADFHRENTHYPRRILFLHYPKYREAWSWST